ncbi:MAG: aminopeptidase P family protein [Firmicutes bacterium HGW-Firmicutes-14]|nr:MAG: aminopeptidase P family protein [Firmicutes bacterium HGW-Firmicutes-14]
MDFTPAGELQNRISGFQAMLGEKQIDGALIIQAADLFYFSGTAQNGHLYIPAQGQPVLMVRKSFSRACEESALEDIVLLTSIKKLPELIAEAGLSVPRVIGLEMDVLPANTYLFYGNIFKDTKTVDISPLIRQARQVKSPYEITLLRESGRKMAQVFREVPSMIREGMSEVELAAKIEGLARSMGHVGYISMRAFNQAVFGHLLSGWSGAVPSAFDGATGGIGLTPFFPQGCSLKTIGRNESILVDYVGLWDGYITDQTRFFSIGPLPANLMNAFETALRIQDAMIERLKPGVNGSEIHELALDMAAEAGLADNFMGFGADRARFVGHGVGLELDELPVLAKGLDVQMQTGMVFALEPKFIFPGEGAVGIENTFVLTEKGAEKITTAPDELIII